MPPFYCSWIQDRFVFVSEELEAVTRKLERWYDVSFFAGESLKINDSPGVFLNIRFLSKVLKNVGTDDEYPVQKDR